MSKEARHLSREEINAELDRLLAVLADKNEELSNAKKLGFDRALLKELSSQRDDVYHQLKMMDPSIDVADKEVAIHGMATDMETAHILKAANKKPEDNNTK